MKKTSTTRAIKSAPCLWMLLLFSCSVLSISFAIPWTAAHQAPLSMGFPRQKYWGGLPFPIPRDLPVPRIKAAFPLVQVDSSPIEPPEKLHVAFQKSYGFTFLLAIFETASLYIYLEKIFRGRTRMYRNTWCLLQYVYQTKNYKQSKCWIVIVKQRYTLKIETVELLGSFKII